jgi:hypothetical protein
LRLGFFEMPFCLFFFFFFFFFFFVFLTIRFLLASFKDGLVLCALLHLADPSAFEWDQVLKESPLERCSRGLSGFEKKFLVPKLMDPEDIVSVPDDKGMTLYLSYCVDILQKKSPAKKTLVGTLQRTPDRRASAPNIAPKYGGGGYISGSPPAAAKPSATKVGSGVGGMKGSPSPNRKPDAAPSFSAPSISSGAGTTPSWTKRRVPSTDSEFAADSASTSPRTVDTIAPPVMVVPAPDVDERLHELQLKIGSKDREIEALHEAVRLLEVAAEKRDHEHREAEDRLNRELVTAKALSAGTGGGGTGKEVKVAIDELKAQVDELEQHNQMLQMSLEDSRLSQRLMEESHGGRANPKASLLMPSGSNDEEEMLRHQVREAERHAFDLEKELADFKANANGLRSSSSGSVPSARETRLQKTVSELEDKVISLEQEARQLKRAADKAARLEKEVAELEEKEIKATQEIRDLKRQLNKATSENSGSSEPTIERKKSSSKLLRSPRERTIPKFDVETTARPLPPGPK